MRGIDGFDLSMKERHTMQELADRAHDIGDIEIARRDFVQHRGKEKKVVAIDESHVQVVSLCKRFFKLKRGIHAAEPPAQNQHAGLSVRHKPSASACTVSYTHLRAHETPEHLVCRLLLEKKK